MEKITPELKDKVLNYFCENLIPEQCCSGETDEILKSLGISFDAFNAVLSQFERYGFIEDLNLRRSYISCILLLDALDYQQRGGFTLQEQMIEANLTKLITELKVLEKELEPKHLETVNKIAGISSSIFGAISLFKK